MKNLIFLIFLPMSIVAFSQSTSFKDNLFDDSSISIEVTKKTDCFLLIIKNDSATCSDSIYNWTIPLIKSVLTKQFSDSDFKKRISDEANRLFYEYTLQDIVSKNKKHQPVAGVIGFENKVVFLTEKQSVEKQYKKELKAAIKNYNKQDRPKTEKVYGQFKVKHKREIADTMLDSTDYFKKWKLKKYGVATKVENLIKTIGEIYDSYQSSKKILMSDSIKLQKQHEQLVIDTLNQNYYCNILNELSQFRLESLDPIKSIVLKNDFDAYINLKKNELEERKISNPNDEILNSYISLLNKLEKFNVESTLKEMFSKHENKNYIDSTTKQMSYLINSNLVELSGRLEIINKKIKNNKSKQIENRKQSKILVNSISDYKNSFLKFQIDSIKVEITKTFIENIVVYGQIEYYDFQQSSFGVSNQKQVTLRNVTPIGISTLNALDLSNKKEKLFAIINKTKYSVPLYNVLAFYRPELKSLRRDYSPVDTVFTVVKDETLQTHSLKRESSNKLFELKIFSDFIGIDGTSSNGLIQTEFSKEMYLDPYRRLFWKNQKRNAYWGIASYIKPSFTLSKIEENNKYYNLDSPNDTAYISALALKQYEIYNVGFDVNMAMFSMPFLKSSLYIDPGMYFGRIGVSDSTYSINDSVMFVSEQGINNLTLKGNIRFVTQVDERYFFEIRGFYQYTSLINNDIIQNPSVGDYSAADFSEKSLLGMEFFAGYSPNKNLDGRLFFRYKYTYSLGSKDGYSQLQLGYSHYFKK